MNPVACIIRKVLQGERITEGEGLSLYANAALPELALAATSMRNRHNALDRVSYVIDRNVNYTDICDIGCVFCAFHKKTSQAGYVLSWKVLEEKARETLLQGGTGFLLQGGVNPALPWEYYLELVKRLRDFSLWVHGFSPVEIQRMASLNGLGLRGTLKALKDAGLGSLPGGGAEILSDRCRRRLSPAKGGVDRWLEVMEAAHEEGILTTGTMMFGIQESLEERMEHLRHLRDQQDRALARGLGRYTSFTAWPFQSGNTPLHGKVDKPTDVEYLRTIAIARIFLDNFPHMQSSWVTMGRKIGQLALHYGCDDMGSLMLEENVVSAAGTSHVVDLASLLNLIHQAGFKAWQRDNVYGSILSGGTVLPR